MTGYVLLILLGALVLAGMRLAGLGRAQLTLAAAALAFGGAGYALQGSPALGGAPRSGTQRPAAISLEGARHAFMGRFSAADRWLVIADGYARRGKTEDAANLLRAALRSSPNDYALWVGLGNALSDHARGLTPAAEYAFDRAEALAPAHPAPRFFRALALARSGRMPEAIEIWRAILAEAPADASWRPLVEDALLLMDRPG